MSRNVGRCRFLLSLLAASLLLSACLSGSPGKGGKNCLDCHAEYRLRFSQGVVHQPVGAEDCAGCHRKHGLIGGVYLKRPLPGLCYSCHEEMGRSLAQQSNLHPPVKEGRCEACHQPHNGANGALLQTGIGEICFECHDRGPFTQTFVHEPLREGCGTCHQTHGASFPSLLGAEKNGLCQNCHDIGSQTLVDTHGGYPVTADCLDCHSVHSSERKALLKNRVHEPVAARECESCHEAAGSKTPFAVSQSDSGLCYGCHDDAQEEFAQDGAHPPARAGECSGCHRPHASDFRGMVKVDPKQLCFECHQFDHLGPDPSAPGAGSAHAPAAEGDCLACHGAHTPTGDTPALLTGDGETLCRNCHDEIAAPRKVAHPPAAEGHCLTCHKPHESGVAGVLVKPQREVCADCHGSVDEEMGKSSLHRPFVVGNCSACHDPHGADKKKLLVADGTDSCGGCHQKIESERQEPERHKPFAEGRCDLCHNAHASDQPFLLTGAAGGLCVSCHQEREIVSGTPSAHQNCAVCHHAHGNDEKSYLLQERPGLCLGCHQVDRYWAEGAGHQPAVEGECGACHDPHAPQKSLSRQGGAALCASCHDVDGAAFAKSHSGIAPGGGSCLGCHDPHGGPDSSLTLPVKHAPFAEGDCTPCHQGGK